MLFLTADIIAEVRDCGGVQCISYDGIMYELRPLSHPHEGEK